MHIRIGLISDIHANWHALSAVLGHFSQFNLHTIWNLGDSVGYGPFPNRVLSKLRSDFILSIQGNYDEKVLKIEKKLKKWRGKKNPDKLFAFQWAANQIDKENHKWLNNLPSNINMNINGLKILLTHATPLSNEGYITNDTPEQELSKHVKSSNADILMFGHTHQQFNKMVDGTTFINPGSVGRPDDGNPQASCAILTLSSTSIETRFFRIDYDVQSEIDAIKEKGLPEKFAEMLQQGRSYNDLFP